MSYAGFWIRLLAYIIDGIIISTPFNFLFASVCYDLDVCGALNELKVAVTAIYLLAFWTLKGATPGGMICKLRIVDETGNKITARHAALRLLGYFLSTIALGIGFIWIGFDEKKQGWHDKIAKTYVIKVS